MTPERWEQIKSVLAEALEEPLDNRSAYLDRSCAGDEDLRREIELCLEHERQLSPRFLNETALPRAFPSALKAEVLPWVGRRIGAYKIIELIGVGGMGEVYRAFRADDQYRKEVALKVVRVGQDSSFIVARFRSERQILASLEHPNIARLLDGGTTDSGAPYLVMELIEGEPIGQYCDSRKLSLADRLALFTEVCAAVQYAHQRLIVHRDIKPSNILVTAEGVPKLLDFGIAKVLGADVQSTETLTALRALTPAYASPEQVKGEPVTTAGDVYSLGVVLYELLTGFSPYSAAAGSPQELLRQIDEVEPEKPSTRVSRLLPGASEGPLPSAEQVSASRNSSPLRLRKRLKGDLDNIVLMALRKEPSRRYASVEQFAEDIRRNLATLPVVAQKNTFGYRVSRFLARHRAAVMMGVAVALAVFTGVVVIVREAKLANRRFNDVRQLANSLIFDVHDSIKDLPGSTPARKIIVDRAVQYLNVLASESGGDTGLKRELATAFEKLGSVQGDFLENNLGDAQGTLASYKKALEIRKQIDSASRNPNDRMALAIAYRLVAHQLWANGDARSARDQIHQAVAISQELYDAHPNDMQILYELGFDYETSGTIGYPGDPSARQKILDDYRRALVAAETLVKNNPNDIRNLYGYSVDLSEVGKWLEGSDAQQALSYYEKVLEIDRKLTQLSTDVRYQRSLAIDYGSVASVYDDFGDYPHALENNLKDLEIYQDLVRKDPKNQLMRRGLAITYANTAASYAKTGRLDSALNYSKRALELMQDFISAAPEKGYGSRIFATMLVYRGTILTIANQPEAAMVEIQRGRSIYESLYKGGAGDQTNVAGADVKLAEAAVRGGHEQEAIEYFHEALNIAEPLIAKSNLEAIYAAADAHYGLGDLSAKKARQQGQSAEARRAHWMEAQSQYQQSLDAWNRLEHPNHSSPINGFQVGDPALVAKQLKVAEVASSARN